MTGGLTVADLNGRHLGKRITITTDHTTATGILQGFEHYGSIITNLTYAGTEYVPGATTTHLTIFPNQRILADMDDEVVVHGDESPEAPEDPGWKVGDTAQYIGIIDGKHLYFGGAAHQAEMNGESD